MHPALFEQAVSDRVDALRRSGRQGGLPRSRHLKRHDRGLVVTRDEQGLAYARLTAAKQRV